MGLSIDMNEVISAGEITKNYEACREQVKENKRVIIFRNNKPDLAIIDINEYTRIMNENERINDLLEDISILEMIQDREKNDTGKRHKLSDVKSILGM